VQSHRLSRLLLTLALLWSAGLVVAALVALFYRTSYSTGSVSPSSAGGFTPITSTAVYVQHSATLVQVNGLWVLVPVSLPLLAVAVVVSSLWFRAKRARPGAGVLAWIVTGLLGVLTLVGMLSIGPFILPAAVLAGAACATTPTGRGWRDG
jgi:hypothetical protein